MDGILELAKLIKGGEAPVRDGPVLGTIIRLPNLQIKLNDRILLDDDDVKSIVRVDQQDEYGRYINLNKQVILLPYFDENKYILLGVVV